MEIEEMKEGIIRQNLLGKRCNQSARSVISGDPTLRVGEIGVPQFIADQLTIPEHVNKYNIDELQKLISEGKATFYTKKGQDKRINLKYALNNPEKQIKLEYGDVVDRSLQNNNYLLANRQP